MNLLPRSLGLSAVVMLLTTHPLPAPIQEVPETPTPTPTPAQSANRQLHPGTQWETPSPRITASPQPGLKRTPLPQTMQQRPVRFAGTWIGQIKFGFKRDVQFTLAVNPEATLLKQQSKQFGEHTHTTSYTAETLSWRAGSRNEVAWTLTPSRDGQTASVTAQSGSEINSRAVFHRVQPNSTAAHAKTPPKTHPGTKLKGPPAY
jgi:hypothetical protein